ncbi:MAG: hypothetical protein ABJF04_03405 [Reichenbachiella sp.]|uniref:hypothetical protein n=1 Tax=Reichenbachiella sp. TaxID=2184521 RepID=UPI0032673ABB
MIKLFKKKKKKLQIKFDKDFNSTVVIKDHTILFIGSKEACEVYIDNHKNE